MLLQQVAEGENHRHIRDSVPDQLDPGKVAHGGYLDQDLFHRRIAQRIPLLLQMDPQHGGQGIGRPAAFLALLGVLGLDQVAQRLSRHHHLHLREKLLPLGPLIGCGVLVVKAPKLVLANNPGMACGQRAVVAKAD